MGPDPVRNDVAALAPVRQDRPWRHARALLLLVAVVAAGVLVHLSATLGWLTLVLALAWVVCLLPLVVRVLLARPPGDR